MTKYNLFIKKRALITGATGAIGGSIASALAKEGVDLILVATKESGLLNLKNKIIQNNADIDIDILCGDLSQQSDSLRIVDEVKEFGGVDILINSAGIFPNKSINNMTLSEYNNTMNVNLNSAYIFSTTLSDLMIKKKWGRIVNIGSSSSYRGFKNTVAYCVSKHGILGLTRALHDELKEYGVRVYCVSPSSTQGRMGMATVGQDYSTFIEPSEVANYVMFIMSHNGNAITEEVLIKRMFVR
jgi:short-subunit dehydrogenase